MMAERKILLTDDDPDIMELVKVKLAGSDYQLLIARDGKEAVETCLQQQPDLILMDIAMPNMDGFEATRNLRANGYNNPIIILTASEEKEDRSMADELGCNGYIVKSEGLPTVKGIIDWTLLHYLDI